MKKNKLLYILTILITLFTFNINVNAEPNFEIKSYEGKTSDISCSGFARMTNELGYDSMALEKLDTTKYNMTCTYGLDIKYSYYVSSNAAYGNQQRSASGCHVIQFSVNRNGNILVSYGLPGSSKHGYVLKDDVYDLKKVIENNGGMCPQNIYSRYTVPDPIVLENGCDGPYAQCKDTTTSTTTTVDPGISVEVTLNETSGFEQYPLSSASGFNWIKGENIKIDNTGYDLIGDKIDILNCEHLFSGAEGKDLLEIIKWVIRLVKIAIPVLLIGLGIMDFAKAVFSGKEDEMKKAQEKFIKRVIIGVCIFLIPTLITYILKLYNLVWDKNINTDFCGILK